MGFELSKEQQDIKKAAREFAAGEFPEVAKFCDEQEKMDMALLKKGRELGFVGVIIPEEYGGPELGFSENALIVEEFWRIGPGLGQAIVSVTSGAKILMAYGSEEQKRRYLRPLAEEDVILATAITEPDNGWNHEERINSCWVSFCGI